MVARLSSRQSFDGPYSSRDVDMVVGHRREALKKSNRGNGAKSLIFPQSLRFATNPDHKIIGPKSGDRSPLAQFLIHAPQHVCGPPSLLIR